MRASESANSGYDQVLRHEPLEDDFDVVEFMQIGHGYVQESNPEGDHSDTVGHSEVSTLSSQPMVLSEESGPVFGRAPNSDFDWTLTLQQARRHITEYERANQNRRGTWPKSLCFSVLGSVAIPKHLGLLSCWLA